MWRSTPRVAPVAILQRPGLNLDDGNVVIGFGGNIQECSTFSGWIVSVPEGGGPVRTYETTPNMTKASVWMEVRRPRSTGRAMSGGDGQRVGGGFDPLRRR